MGAAIINSKEKNNDECVSANHTFFITNETKTKNELVWKGAKVARRQTKKKKRTETISQILSAS